MDLTYRVSPDEQIRRTQICTQLIADWIPNNRGMPLVYGITDCAQMARDLAIRLGFPDPMKEFPRYSDPDEAKAILESLGYKTIAKYLTAKMMVLPSVGYSIDGDIALVRSLDSRFKHAIAIRCDAQNFMMFVQADDEQIPSVKKFPVSDAWGNDKYILKAFRFK